MPGVLLQRSALVLLSFAVLLPGVSAQPAAPKLTGAGITARAPREFLTSPRRTLETLYFAVVAYDLQPKLIDEAIACLDLDADGARDSAEAARLAIDLEQILRTLCVPIHSVPEKSDRNAVSVFDGDGIRIYLARGADGLWRFSRDTVERIPAMTRTALAQFRDLQASRAALEEDFADPSATMRRFLIDTIGRDFYAAARCLDLSGLDQAERSDKGPLLARHLGFVMQRRGWLFLQEVPNNSVGPPFTWHADKTGRIILERTRRSSGKEAWLFSKKTVRNIVAMYEQVKDLPADPRYVRLGVALPPLPPNSKMGTRRTAPARVPQQLGSPRAMLEGFFSVMNEAETQDARLAEALPFLDLSAIPPDDVTAQGTKLACKLEAVLRKISIELSSLPDDWNAPPQVLGENQGVRIEIVRQRDGCWRFSQNTIGQTQVFFDKVVSQDKTEHDRTSRLDSARDTMATFLRCMSRGEYELAAECIDLSSYHSGTQEEAGPLVAYKLKFIIDRIGKVYIQEVPDKPDGPRYVFYRGELGRIVLARKSTGAKKGCWLFTQDTVAVVEKMFRTLINQAGGERLARPTFWRAPGIWIRCRTPARLRSLAGKLQLYQWLGLALAAVLCSLLPWLLLRQAHRLLALILRKSGSALTEPFVAARLRPLTWLAGWWLLFQILALLDMPIRFVDTLLPFKIFGLAFLIGLLGVQLVDLATAVYTNSELLRPHRNLSDMVVPVSMRALKGSILLLVAVYLIYQVGEADSLGRFLTGLGVAGLAASLAAQDALKSFFSTLLLIGERSFKIGDRIAVAGLEGTVEQVGFRATRLRTSDGSLLTVPNSTITSVPIDNLTTKAFTRCKATLLVNSDTETENILELRDRIKSWLVQHPKVRPDKVEVSVNRLTEHGVEVALDLYLADASGADEKELKEELNCEVLRLTRSLSARDISLHYHAGDDKSQDKRSA